ncbi:ABC transporter ATP-binding protein [Globicatella sanguinis]|uniref:ABC transporter ATP-binding protein n=1 Tax=Globicatella sanguinis TaxID=13076 RepID=UPI002543396B|nr:sn-glycerol-3-phosphate ABC transporter ATP-binding protein UgpC [Globicatella sanguinis]MDK7629978.1 sn-glycerol-3-phosphate ABC transporter ATP-binding protein UgpC [Globicatella sanguinis]WIK66677.1 sn-glycerol-3-phosphate ABC transporter ATP-binding protein UgpC [Globicatella sanguinis]WKT56082.1 sn-glycerol-3-phosphate ABC transporter ATP-binding protein UgpC [Globicatella sanguinis]
MANVKLKKVAKIYEDGYKAVKNIDLDIQDGEFIVFVGPSGCGKSTTLRMIAGLERISEGELFIDDVLVNNMSPKARDIAMVFQSYALYPHMTNRDNVAFSMKLSGVSKKERYRRAEEVAKILQLEPVLDKKPGALSGGQRQRVALGRAMVRNPKVFLLDEPLSNLDAKLRVSMRAEIVALHRELKNTFIYVTHDQTEAMTMGDRIAVMSVGNVEQFDTPANLYHNPANVFVAEFIGSPQMNMLSSKLVMQNGKPSFALSNRTIELPNEIAERLIVPVGNQEILVGIRPENIKYKKVNDDSSVFTVTANNVEQIGSDTYVYFEFPDAIRQCAARFNPPRIISYGQAVHVKMDLTKLSLFDKATGKTILSPKELAEEL